MLLLLTERSALLWCAIVSQYLYVLLDSDTQICSSLPPDPQPPLREGWLALRTCLKPLALYSLAMSNPLGEQRGAL